MERRASRQIEADMAELMEMGESSTQEEVVRRGIHVLAEDHTRQAWLRAELAIGEEQEKLGQTVIYRPDWSG